MYPHLYSGYTVRSPTEEDIPAIVALLRDYDLAEMGEADATTAAEILSDWTDLDPAQDAWVVWSPDGLPAGYATIADDGAGRLLVDGYVHPAHTGRGIGITLIQEMERRAAALVAAQPEGTRLVLVSTIAADSAAARHLFETQGYTLARVYLRMQIALEEQPPAPAWPEGISVRAWDGSLEDARRVHAAIEEGFRDHWAHVPRSFEDWQKHMFYKPVDPSLWLLAQAGDQIVGAALCRTREEGFGWVGYLTVLRPWRKRGLGLALLQHVFTLFAQRGIRRVGLGVDGQSLTGAQRLYERAGMRVYTRLGRCEKELRPGRDLLDEPE